jgi:D-xylose transport system substrate-binding protein
MYKKKLSILALLATFVALAALPKVAVLDIGAQKGIDPSVVVPVTETIMEETVGARAYVVLDRAYIEQVLREQEFDTSSMVSDTQAAQAGQFLGADYVIAGKVQTLDGTYFLVAKMIEVRTGVIVSQASARGEGKLTALLDMAQSIGRKLVAGAPIQPLGPATSPVAGQAVVGQAGASQPLIGISFPEFAGGWRPGERDQMVQLLKAAGYDAIIQGANKDPGLQNDQVRAMAAQGAKVIIVVPQDGWAMAPTVNELAAQGVKVIAYDRLILSPRIAAYLSFDNVEVGRCQARAILAAKGKGNFVLLGGDQRDNNARLFRQGQMEILQPLIDSGKVKIVADRWVENWDPAGAKRIMEEIIGDTKGKFDAVVSSNDGTALGAIEALRARGMAGKVPVSGQDASAQGCNSVARGELTATILKDARRLIPMVCETAVKLARGEAIPGLLPYPISALSGDPGATESVPGLFAPVLPVTKANLRQLVVDSGYQSYEAVYAGVKGAPPK